MNVPELSLTRLRLATRIAAVVVCLLAIGAGHSGHLQAQPRPSGSGGPPRSPFPRLDRNQDGRLTPDEIPEQLRPVFRAMDTNGDGIVTAEEESAFRQRRIGNNNASPRLPEGTIAHRDLAYVEQGHERHKLDVFVPASPAGKRPLVVWIHGGGWQNGSKENNPALVLLNSGYVVASINYRLSGHATFPAQIHDCKAAIRFLKENASTYRIDPERVGVWGSSAGGHLAALVGTSGDAPELEGNLGVTTSDSRVQAVCDYFGPTDFTLMNAQAGGAGRIDHSSPNSPESKLLGGTPAERPEAARAASPLTYVSANDPPFLIVHGDQDPLVPLGQSQLLLERLLKAGVDAELYVVAGGGHGRFADPSLPGRVIEFFNRILKPEN